MKFLEQEAPALFLDSYLPGFCSHHTYLTRFNTSYLINQLIIRIRCARSVLERNLQAGISPGIGLETPELEE